MHITELRVALWLLAAAALAFAVTLVVLRLRHNENGSFKVAAGAIAFAAFFGCSSLVVW